jgi:hypothetical protein
MIGAPANDLVEGDLGLIVPPESQQRAGVHEPGFGAVQALGEGPARRRLAEREALHIRVQGGKIVFRHAAVRVRARRAFERDLRLVETLHRLEGESLGSEDMNIGVRRFGKFGDGGQRLFESAAGQQLL